METNHLHEFITIVDEGSFSKAAKVLHCTQPTLSKHMAALEHEFSCALLERSGGRVYPTKEGRILYAHAARIQQLVQNVYSSLAPHANSARLSNSNKAKSKKIKLSSAFKEKWSLSSEEFKLLEFYLNGKDLESIAANTNYTRDEVATILGNVYKKTNTHGKHRLEELVKNF